MTQNKLPVFFSRFLRTTFFCFSIIQILLLLSGSWLIASPVNNYLVESTEFIDSLNNDYKEGAIELADISGWCSGNAEFTNDYGTPDGGRPSGWDNGPNYNVWFKFQATTTAVNIELKSGGDYGTLLRPQMALYTGVGVELISNRNGNSNELALGYNSLIVGGWYYISVDVNDPNNYDNRQGTFTLCMDDEVNNDFREGAIELTDISGWCSGNAEFSNQYGTPDGDLPSGWEDGPNYNVWFKFQATTTSVNIELKSGGDYGTLLRPQMALYTEGGVELISNWNGDGNELALGYNSLIVGGWYYFSVDVDDPNDYDNRQGTFTLCVDNLQGVLPPSGLVAKVAQVNSVQLTWTDNSSNEDGFILERKLNGGTYHHLDSLGADQTGYTDSNVFDGNTYQYRLLAYNGTINSSYSNESNVTMPSNPGSGTGGQISITSPPAGSVFDQGDTIRLKSEVSLPSSGGNYPVFTISSTDGALERVKFSPNADGVYVNTYHDVTSGGVNDTLLITMRDVGGNADWASIGIRAGGEYPYSNFMGHVSDDNGWFDIKIPLSHFTWDFTSIRNITICRNWNPGAYSIAFRKIVFTGSGDPAKDFYFFGSNKADVTWTEHANFTMSVGQESGDNIVIESVEFIVNSSSVGNDSISPYQHDWIADITGTANISTQAHLSDQSILTDSIAVTINKLIEAPNAPGDLTLSVIGGIEIQLNWIDNAFNEDGFVIERSLNGGNFIGIDSLKAHNITEYLDSNVFVGDSCEYRVHAYNEFGFSEWAIAPKVFVYGPEGIIPDQTEYDALMAIHNQTNDHNWFQGENWGDYDKPLSEWQGVYVENGDVTKLWINGMGLSGSLPPELGQLTGLKDIEIWYDQVCSLPNEIENLSNLQRLTIGVSGCLQIVPAEITNIGSLEEIRLIEVGLKSLPLGFSGMPNLKSLDVADNQLAFQYLEPLYAGPGQTAFDGQVVTGNQYDIEGKNLYQSFVGGIVSMESGINGDQTHWQWQKQIDGIWTDIAGANDSFLKLYNIQNADQGMYRCTATNDWVTGLTMQTQVKQLEIIDMDNGVPDDFEYEALMTIYDATNGAEWNENPLWGDSNLPFDQWYGLQTEAGDVTHLTILRTTARGSIPPEISHLRKLKRIQFGSLGGAHISSIPDEILLLDQLEDIYLSGNELEEFPFGIDTLTNLKTVSISSNRIPFQYIEQFFSAPGVTKVATFYYKGQKAIGKSESVELDVHDSFTLRSQIGGQYTNWQWQKIIDGQWIDILGATASDLAFASVQPSDDGQYRCVATNEWVTDLTLYTATKTINIAVDENYNQIPDTQELQALTAIFRKLGGEGWTDSTNWLKGTSSSDFAGWYGITVVNGDVTKVDLQGNNLKGEVPPEILQLGSLKVLRLNNNQLKGEIPVQLARLEHLESFYLNDNQLEGYMDLEFSVMPNIRVMALQDNNLVSVPDFSFNNSVDPLQITLNAENNKLEFYYIENNLNTDGSDILGTFTYMPQKTYGEPRILGFIEGNELVLKVNMLGRANHYQWQFSSSQGQSWTDRGTDDPEYTETGIGESQEGWYRVRITNDRADEAGDEIVSAIYNVRIEKAPVVVNRPVD